ncbi:MAG TPA: biotin/lipoyl-binding protein, partial [Candidatus Binatia bacterium]|nr:biotin/lipoyl-binding protein [Candidatus Binatia bacterium]
MAETAEELRRHLAALRLERGTAGPPRRRRRWLVPAIVLAVVVLAALGLGVLRGRPVPVEVVQSLVAGGADAGVAILSGAGYVVSADRYISIGVRVAGRIDRYLAEEGDHVQPGDPLVQLDAREYEAAVQRAQANLLHARAEAKLRATQLAR